MTFYWPHTILKPRDVTRQLLARTTSGTTAASGFTQRISVPAHAWSIEYGGIIISTKTELEWWDSVEAQLDGGAVAMYVPLVGDDNGPTEGAFQGDHVAGQTTITLFRNSAAGDSIGIGYHFSTGDGRLHRIFGVNSHVGDDYSVEIRPPLRDDYVHGTSVTFQTPVCKCRLASDTEMRLTLTPGRYGVGNIKWLEDPN